MTARTYRRAPVRVTVSKKSQASSASAWERRKLAQVVEVRSGAGSIPAWLEDLPHGGGGDLDAEDEQFAVDAPVAPARDSPGPGAAPAGGWSGRCAAGPGAWAGTWPRGGARAGRGASAAPCRAAPAAGTGRARRGGAGAAGRPGTPGRLGGTAAGSCPAAVPAPRSGGAAPGSPRPCPGRSPASSRSNANAFVTPR